MLFRLKERCGNHVEGGKIYEAGDIIETDNDLETLFHGKNANGSNRPGKFERIYDKVEKDTGKKDTSRVKPPIPPSVAKVDDEKVDDGTKEPEDGEVEKAESEYGNDVTSDFPTAKKVKVTVFEKSKWYMVIDNDGDDVLNDKKKLRRKEVEPFLEQYLTDDENEQ